MNRRIGGKLDEKGAALAELALVFPLILLISLAGLESSGLLAAYQAATQLSGELATAAFRKCGLAGGMQLETQACIDELLGEFQAQSAIVAPGTEIQLSLYHLIDGKAHLVAHAFSGNRSSKLHTGSFDANFQSTPLSRALNRLIDNYRVVVAAELFVTPGAVAGSVAPLFFFSQEPIYAATIM